MRKKNYTTRSYAKSVPLSAKSLKAAIEALKNMQERTWRVINRYTYKGKGRPRKSDYKEMTMWEIQKMNTDIRMAKLFSNAFTTTYIPEGKPLCSYPHHFKPLKGDVSS